MTIKSTLSRDFSGIVVAISNPTCVFISASKDHRNVHTTLAKRSGRFNKVHGPVRLLCMSLINNCMKTVHKCFKNNGHPNTSPTKMSSLGSDARS